MHQESLEKANPPTRTKKLTRGIMSLLMTTISLTACSSRIDEPKAADNVPTARAAYNPAIGQYAKYYGADLLSAGWAALEIHPLDGHKLKIYREKDKGSTEGLKQQMLKAASNSLILATAGVEIDDVTSLAASSKPKLQALPEQSHVFFLFGSVESIKNANPAGGYGPSTATKATAEGQIVENLTMLAPFPNSNFIFHSKLDNTLYERQVAVCGNMIDVDIGADAKTRINMANPNDQRAAAMEQAKESLRINRSACENLALAVTIKSGSHRVEHLGGAYKYYGGITDALQGEASFNGQPEPYIKLTPEVFSQIVV